MNAAAARVAADAMELLEEHAAERERRDERYRTLSGITSGRRGRSRHSLPQIGEVRAVLLERGGVQVDAGAVEAECEQCTEVLPVDRLAPFSEQPCDPDATLERLRTQRAEARLRRTRVFAEGDASQPR